MMVGSFIVARSTIGTKNIGFDDMSPRVKLRSLFI